MNGWRPEGICGRIMLQMILKETFDPHVFDASKNSFDCKRYEIHDSFAVRRALQNAICSFM